MLDRAISEAADLVLRGRQCYILKTDFSVIEAGDPDSCYYCDGNPELETTIAEIEINAGLYYFIEKISSDEAYEIMRDFIEEKIEVEAINDSLCRVLGGNRSFRRFKNCLLDMGIEQQCHDYQQ